MGPNGERRGNIYIYIYIYECIYIYIHVYNIHTLFVKVELQGLDTAVGSTGEDRCYKTYLRIYIYIYIHACIYIYIHVNNIYIYIVWPSGTEGGQLRHGTYVDQGRGWVLEIIFTCIYTCVYTCIYLYRTEEGRHRRGTYGGEDTCYKSYVQKYMYMYA